MPIRGVAFDVFNTLVDLAPLQQRLAAHIGDDAEAVFAGFFPRLVSWSWHVTAAGEYRPFAEVGVLALRAAAAANATALPEPAAREVVGSMSDLPLFEGAAGAIQSVRDGGVATAILANGTAPAMRRLLGLRGIEGLFDHLLVADSVRRLKPAPEVYRLAAEAFAARFSEIVLVSGNDWDCAGAALQGMRTIWTSRGRPYTGFLDRPPDRIVQGLAGVPEAVAGLTED